MLRGLELGLPEDRVLAPLRWLNEQFRQLCYTAPDAGLRAACINLVISAACKELGEYRHLGAELVAEGRVSDPELPRLKRELDEAVRAALEMQKALEHYAEQQRLAVARPVQFGDRAREEASQTKDATAK
jgi:hypothetical protein